MITNKQLWTLRMQIPVTLSQRNANGNLLSDQDTGMHISDQHVVAKLFFSWTIALRSCLEQLVGSKAHDGGSSQTQIHCKSPSQSILDSTFHKDKTYLNLRSTHHSPFVIYFR